MKIAFCIRKGYDTLVGGDSIQLQKTQAFLEQNHGVHIEVFTDAAALHAGFDLVHIFNLATRAETTAFFSRAKTLGLKVALSTIFWDYKYQATKDLARLVNYDIFSVPGTMPFFLGFDALCAGLLQKPRVIAGPFRNFIRSCVHQSDLLLPNSAEELEQLAVFAGIPPGQLWPRTRVIHNATDIQFPADNQTAAFRAAYGLPEGYVLQVGRIEYIKNQMGTLLALYDQPEVPIVFVGRSNDEKYYELVKKKATRRGNVHFVEQVPHADIYQFFRHARLHVLPSLRESPGLVNLEALINGCPIVVSDKRFLPFETYFKGIATEVNPLSLSSIRAGIAAELRTPRNFAAIAEHIRAEFSWSRAAQQTFDAYRLVLGD